MRFQRIEFANFRFYFIPDEGLVLPSVTTVLSHTTDLRKKQFLNTWAEENPLHSAVYIEDGNLVHLYYEWYNSKKFNLPFERPERARQLQRGFTSRQKRLIKNYKPLNDMFIDMYYIEHSIYYYEPDTGLGYAGTVDKNGMIKLPEFHKPFKVVGDTKTSEKVKTPSLIGDYYIQSSAYVLGENFLSGNDDEISNAVILISQNQTEPNKRYRYFPIGPVEINNYLDAFFDRLEAFAILKNDAINYAIELAKELKPTRIYVP